MPAALGLDPRAANLLHAAVTSWPASLLPSGATHIAALRRSVCMCDMLPRDSMVPGGKVTQAAITWTYNYIGMAAIAITSSLPWSCNNAWGDGQGHSQG